MILKIKCMSNHTANIVKHSVTFLHKNSYVNKERQQQLKNNPMTMLVQIISTH